MWSKLSYINTNTKPRENKAYSCKSICILTALLFVAIILFITYFSRSSPSNLDSRSPAQNLLQLPSETDQSEVSDSFYPSEITFDPDRVITESDKTQTSSYYKTDGLDDLITSMPNLVHSTCSDSQTQCKFKQYSGYLLANNNRELHYWFIESEVTPLQKPVFVWTNGGPGCSGLDGLLTEHGPWRALKNGNIAYNKYSWINEVNILYLEQPFGVGFSSVEIGESVVGGDQNAADDMDAAIRDFINKFSVFEHSTFYMSSESWGGHYVPIATYTILKNNERGVKPYINLGGFLLGNPSTDPYENKYGFVGDIYGHGLLKSTDWYTWRSECWDNSEAIETSNVCSAIHTRAYYMAFNSNVYALDYPQCFDDEDWSDDFASTNAIDSSQFLKNAGLHKQAIKSMKKVLNSDNYNELKMGHIKRNNLQRFYDRISERLNKKQVQKNKIKRHISNSEISTDEVMEMYEDYEPCIDHYMDAYLNSADTQKALNVKPVQWDMCSSAVWSAWPESDFEAFIEPYYQKIIDKYAHKLGLTLTVYSGDDDSVCGLQGTMYWLDRIGYDTNENIVWQPWRDETDELGGYYTQYMDKKGNVGLHFITVRSAGHMVPTTEPSRALEILRKFLYNFQA